VDEKRFVSNFMSMMSRLCWAWCKIQGLGRFCSFCALWTFKKLSSLQWKRPCYEKNVSENKPKMHEVERLLAHALHRKKPEVAKSSRQLNKHYITLVSVSRITKMFQKQFRQWFQTTLRAQLARRSLRARLPLPAQPQNLTNVIKATWS